MSLESIVSSGDPAELFEWFPPFSNIILYAESLDLHQEVSSHCSQISFCFFLKMSHLLSVVVDSHVP